MSACRCINEGSSLFTEGKEILLLPYNFNANAFRLTQYRRHNPLQSYAPQIRILNHNQLSLNKLPFRANNIPFRANNTHFPGV